MALLHKQKAKSEKKRKKTRKSKKQKSVSTVNTGKSSFLDSIPSVEEQQTMASSASAKDSVKALGKKVQKGFDQINGRTNDEEGTATLRLYQHTSKRTFIILIAVVIILGYLFFFTSPQFIKPKAASNDPTPLGEAQQFGEDGQKSLTIQKWVYSPSQAMMEIWIVPDNQAFDGKNSYEFETAFQGAKKWDSSPSIDQMVHDEDLIVLILRDIPEKWVSIDLQAYYQGETKGDPLVDMYASFDSISRTQHIKVLSSNQYRASVVDTQIQSLQKQIQGYQNQIKQNEQTITNMDKEAQRINGDMALDTDDEKASDKDDLEEIKQRQKELEQKNQSLESQIADVNGTIGQLQKKRNSYLGIVSRPAEKAEKSSDKKESKSKKSAPDVAIQTTQSKQSAKSPDSEKKSNNVKNTSAQKAKK